MHGQANLASSVHLQTSEKTISINRIIKTKKLKKFSDKCKKIEQLNLLGLPIELRELELGSRGGVRNRNIKLKIEFIL